MTWDGFRHHGKIYEGPGEWGAEIKLRRRKAHHENAAGIGDAAAGLRALHGIGIVPSMPLSVWDIKVCAMPLAMAGAALAGATATIAALT
jgi:hypothetical protein